MDKLHKGWFTEFSPDDLQKMEQGGKDCAIWKSGKKCKIQDQRMTKIFILMARIWEVLGQDRHFLCKSKKFSSRGRANTKMCLFLKGTIFEVGFFYLLQVLSRRVAIYFHVFSDYFYNFKTFPV